MYIRTSLSMFTYRVSGFSGLSALLAVSGALFSLRLARSRPQKKNSMSFALDFRVLPREHGRPSSILGLPDGPGLDFGGRNASIFEVFRRSRAFGVNFLRSVQNYSRSYIFHTSELPRDDTKTAKNRSAGSFDNARCSECTRTSLWGGPGASWDRPGLALGRLPAALGEPGASQDRS